MMIQDLRARALPRRWLSFSGSLRGPVWPASSRRRPSRALVARARGADCARDLAPYSECQSCPRGGQGLSCVQQDPGRGKPHPEPARHDRKAGRTGRHLLGRAGSSLSTYRARDAPGAARRPPSSPRPRPIWQSLATRSAPRPARPTSRWPRARLPSAWPTRVRRMHSMCSSAFRLASTRAQRPCSTWRSPSASTVKPRPTRRARVARWSRPMRGSARSWTCRPPTRSPWRRCLHPHVPDGLSVEDAVSKALARRKEAVSLGNAIQRYQRSDTRLRREAIAPVVHRSRDRSAGQREHAEHGGRRHELRAARDLQESG